ncbi:DUF6924 domain-containing protein [Streptomyces sp. NPDC002755]|uniref:DUF6924 domain-containing protein n=1 Tax=Streptomyces sp. NPDC002884 TaxID=3154544 RepID=UPI0033295705
MSKLLSCRAHTTPLVRTCFSDEQSWQALLLAVSTPTEEDFLANLDIVDDSAYRGLSAERMASLTPPDVRLVVLADEAALAVPERPLLVLRTGAGRHEELRVIAAELWSVENNITWANMDWAEFTDAADEDGVFRGF